MYKSDAPGFIKKEHSIFASDHLKPSRILTMSFALVILIGTILLMLPISSQSGEMTSFIDAFFTTTSAVCVTGLVVVNTFEYWSTFGKAVIMLCIQIGGLGFMTLVSMMFILMGKKISLRNRLIMQEAFNLDTTSGIVRFTINIVKGTLLVELIGAILLSFAFIPEYGWIRGTLFSVFHSISAFCNAGFDLIGPSSLSPYVGNGIVNFTIMLLIILGGLGFNVWMDVINVVKIKLKAARHFTWKQAFYKLPLHSKLVLIISGFLILFGTAFFFIVEFANPATLGMLTLKEKIYAAFFQSVSPRTAGFFTVGQNSLTDASKIMTMILMLIGGSPTGTAGGIKTVTVGVLILCALSTIRGKQDTIVFGRKVSFKVIVRALTVIMIALFVLVITLMILSLTEDASFMDLCFEVVSGFATVGLTLGLTPNLTAIGKLVLASTMFIGRLGPVTIAMALTIKQAKNSAVIDYPEEKIIVG